MYELYVLGELMDQAMHGYLLHTILNRIVGPMRKISWGVLYPLIRRLESEGFIEQVPDEQPSSGGGKKKKTYGITADGKRQFFQLMEEPIEYTADYELHFQIKMANFDHIDDEIRRIILYQYKDYLRFVRRHIEDNKTHILDSKCIPESERPNLLRIIDQRLVHIGVDETWVEKQMKQAMGVTNDDNK